MTLSSKKKEFACNGYAIFLSPSFVSMGLGGLLVSGGCGSGGCCGSAVEDSLLIDLEFIIPLPTERGDAVPASSMLLDSCCNSYLAWVRICLEEARGENAIKFVLSGLAKRVIWSETAPLERKLAFLAGSLTWRGV